jgi:hypothetical protein
MERSMERIIIIPKVAKIQTFILRLDKNGVHSLKIGVWGYWNTGDSKTFIFVNVRIKCVLGQLYPDESNGQLIWEKWRCVTAVSSPLLC